MLAFHLGFDSNSPSQVTSASEPRRFDPCETALIFSATRLLAKIIIHGENYAKMSDQRGSIVRATNTTYPAPSVATARTAWKSGQKGERRRTGV